MKLNDWNNFLINENMDKAKSYMKTNGHSTSDDGFKLLRDLLSKNMGYMYKFTEFYYGEGVSIDDLTSLLSFLTGGDSSKLRNTLDSYNSYVDLIDEIELIKLNKEVKAVYDELLPSQKVLFLKPNGYYDKKFATLAQEINKIENKASFFRKIAKAHDYYEIIDLMTDFITKYKSGGSYASIMSKIAEFSNDTEIVYDDPENEIIICKIKEYVAGSKLGSTNWCIVNQPSNWQSYVYPSESNIRQQYYIWNFSLGISDPNYLCGATIDNSGIAYAHDFNDSDIKRQLPTHIRELSSYLKPVPEEEVDEYVKILRKEKADKQRLESLATQQRLSNLRDQNSQRRDDDEWGEHNGLMMSVIEYLVDEHNLDLEYLEEEGEDIYDVLFQTHENGGIYTFEFENIEFMAATYDDAYKYSEESCRNLCDEFKNDLTELFGANNSIIANNIDEDAIIRDYERDVDEDDIYWEDVDWSEYFDEDEIRDNWENYPDIIADEDGDMDEDSFDEYIEKLKDDHRDDVIEKENDSINDELKDDPIEYVRMHYGESNLSSYVNVEGVVEDMMSQDGYAHNLSSYDGNVYEHTVNDETYSVWRHN